MSPRRRVSIFLVFEIWELESSEQLTWLTHPGTWEHLPEREGQVECPEWCFSFLARWNPRQSIPFMSVSLSLDAVSILTITVAQHCHSPVRFSARQSLAPPPSIRGCKELRSRWCPLLTGQVRNAVERSSHNHSSCLQALPFPMWVYFGCQACKENPSHSWNGEAGLCVFIGVCFVDEWSSAFPGGNGLNPWFLKHNRRWWCHILLR